MKRAGSREGETGMKPGFSSSSAIGLPGGGQPAKSNVPLMFDRQRQENASAFAAFKTYLELGPEQSLAVVADKLGKIKMMIEQLVAAYMAKRVGEIRCKVVRRLMAEIMAQSNPELTVRAIAIRVGNGIGAFCKNLRIFVS